MTNWNPLACEPVKFKTYLAEPTTLFIKAMFFYSHDLSFIYIDNTVLAFLFHPTSVSVLRHECILQALEAMKCYIKIYSNFAHFEAFRLLLRSMSHERPLGTAN
jgi:hypothetical protein